MKITVVLKKDDETWSYTGAKLNAGNGVIQVTWDGGRRARLWPISDVRFCDAEEEDA